MLPDNGADGERQPTEAGPLQPVIIDSNLIMKGELRFDCETDLVVLGSVDGTSIRGVRNLSIGKHGTVSGDVQSVTAEIAGTLNGCANISETAFVRRTARLHGEVTARCVKIEKGTKLEGCVLSGKIQRDEDW